MKKNILILFIIFFLISLFIFLNTISYSSGPRDKQNVDSLKKNPIETLLEETLAFFQPLEVKIVAVEGSKVRISFDPQKGVVIGMRLKAFKEGVDFIHPVTKERLGKIAVPIGDVEIDSITASQATGIIISGKPEDFNNVTLRIPATKVRILFHQGSIDWFVGDSYYQLLKDSNRFELIDSSSETDDIQKILSEAKSKNAIAALILTEVRKGRDVDIIQKLFWADNKKQFSEKKITTNVDFINELRQRSGIPGMMPAELLFSYDLPFSAHRIVAGDFDGDQSIEIGLVSDHVVRFYTSKVDLNLLWELKLPLKGDILWIDKVKVEGSLKELILITLKTDNDVISYVYELQGENFVKLWNRSSLFIREVNNKILAQRFSPATGYEGNIFLISHQDKSFKEGPVFPLPPGVNLYDFQEIFSPEREKFMFAWDEEGYLRLFDEKNIVKWRSKESLGDFSIAFAKETLSGLFDKGKWSIKDKLIYKDGEVFTLKKDPLLSTVRGLGYKESSIMAYWWNGTTVEERKFIENISGEIIDYAITEDRLLILSRPIFGLKLKNILKGESPFGVILYIYSIRGK